MENLDLVVLRALHDWRRAGKRALLATVVIVATLTSARGCNKPEPKPEPPAPGIDSDQERHIVPVDVSLG